MTKISSFGTWSSPLSGDGLARAPQGRDFVVAVDPQGVWLCEQQPGTARMALVWRDVLGRAIRQTPDEFDVRTTINEYGGVPALVVDSVAFFSNRSDGHIYMWHGGAAPRRITPESPFDRRFGDLEYDKTRRRLVAVMEEHGAEGEPRHSLVAISVFGDETLTVLRAGADFYASPKLDPAGGRLAWIEWNHPAMPWDQTRLCVASVRAEGSLGQVEIVSGRRGGKAILDPQWSPGGVLHWISDASGFWNLYRQGGRSGSECVWPLQADFAAPLWRLGVSSYGFFDLETIVCTFFREGKWLLGLVDGATLENVTLDTDLTYFTNFCTGPRHAAFMAASWRSPLAPHVLTRDFRLKRLQEAPPLEISSAHIAEPRMISVPTSRGYSVRVYLFEPKNPDFSAPEGTLPPLVLLAHGGPTGAFVPHLDLKTQFYTSRGFAVAWVDYCGSSGSGRLFREALKGRWGVADVADCADVAKTLAEKGWVDGARMAIEGGSAGGYIALGAMVFHDVFAAAISSFGVADLSLLRLHTHKFESRYLGGLLGENPEKAERERSPIHHLEKVKRPILFLHGLEDKVVPPEQSRLMHESLRARALASELVEFPGEGHGFRDPVNIARSAECKVEFLRKHLVGV